MTETDKEIPILSMDDHDFAEKFKAAIGLQPGEAAQFLTPQFERTDGLTPVANPHSLFSLLHAMPEKTLRAVGMQNFDGRLWLFPYEWFNAIPQGFSVESINGKKSKWDVGTHSDDMRFGALAYGIVPEFAKRKRSHD
jgi:hypothetical protein